MTEQQPAPQEPDDDVGAQTATGRDVAHAGGGRTEGETAVDDALGQADEPHR
jgi:hypothetical protein